MKLRFVKFLTSRGNEIQEQEDDDGTTVLCHHPARPRPEPALHLPPPSSFPLSPSTLHLSLHPPPPQLVLRHVSEERCSPAVSALVVLPLPFFFIKLRNQQSVAERTVAEHPLADPAVLPNDNPARPARRHPCFFIKSNDG